MINKIFQWAKACNFSFINLKQFDQVQANRNVLTKLEIRILYRSPITGKYGHFQACEVEDKLLEEIRGILPPEDVMAKLFEQFFPKGETIETEGGDTQDLDFL